jgi:hypothetical protein
MTEFRRALVDFQHREVLVVALCERRTMERDIARCPRLLYPRKRTFFAADGRLV